MQISIDEARSGMVLTEDVGIAGDVLLHKAEVLDETLITLLKNCGITTVEITDPAKNTDNTENPPNEVEPSIALDTLTSVTPQTTESAPTPGPAEPEPSDSVQPPEIQVVVSPDRMNAILSLKPVPGISPASINRQIILKALRTAGIRFGIDHDLVETTAQRWSVKPDYYEIPDIASGVPPIEGIDGDMEMQVPHLSSNTDCDKVRSLGKYHLVNESFPNTEMISAGALIAMLRVVHPATPGTDIFGNTIPAPPTSFDAIPSGENIKASDDGRTALALCSGIAYRVDANIGVIPVDPDGSFEIEISSDQMTARCKVLPPGPGGSLPDKKALQSKLREASIHFGINESDIDTFLLLCSRRAYPEEPFVIARGLAPIDGKDGDLLYHFSTDTSFVPAINSDGSADYKSINIVTTVSKGQELVSIVPPGEGHEGSDVFGRVLPAKPGKPARLPQGKNTSIDPQNPSVLVAGIEGNVRITGGLVEVCEGFIIRGNVDYSTGNINYNKTIQISGDVKAGFDIHAGEDLQVNGIIEDCQISAGGCVLCRCGFLGQGKGLIDAKGDVNLSFIKNQSVRSFKSINIAKEAINSFLYSRTVITLHGKPLSAAGGEFHAKNQIIAYAVGNHTGIKTLLEVGVDYLMVEELAMIEKQIEKTTAHFKTVADAFTHYQKNAGRRKQLSEDEQSKFKELTSAFKQARQKLTVLEERKTIVAGKVYNFSDARITIEHSAFPGTLLKFGDRHHYLKEELIGPKTIIYAGHEIKIV